VTPGRLRECLEALGWSQGRASTMIGCSDRLVRLWAAGREPIPEPVAVWLETLAAVHEANPPPVGWRRPRFGRYDCPQ
jgi:hypothetical protein